MTFENTKVQGLKELADALKQLPTNIGKNVLRGAVNAGASVIKKEVAARAPVYTGKDPRATPGMMKKAVYQKQIRERSSVFVQTFFVGVRQGKSAKAVKTSSGDAFYWKFVEFGTKKMSARPFVRPGFNAKANEAVQAIKEYLEKRIPLEAEKLGKK